MEALDLLQTVARGMRVPCRPLEIADRAHGIAGPHPQLPGEAEGPREPGFVAELLEDRDGIRELDLGYSMGRLTREEAEVGERDAAVGGHPAVA